MAPSAHKRPTQLNPTHLLSSIHERCLMSCDDVTDDR